MPVSIFIWYLHFQVHLKYNNILEKLMQLFDILILKLLENACKRIKFWIYLRDDTP